jgi:hypothetical protein
MSLFGYDTPVAEAFYNDYEMETETFREVYSIYETDYSPIRLFTDDEDNDSEITYIDSYGRRNTRTAQQEEDATTEEEDAADDLPDLIPSSEIERETSEYYSLNLITVYMSVYTTEEKEEPSDTFDCPVCLENVPNANGAITNCNHHYCRDCILNYAISCRHKDMRCALCRSECKNLEVSDIETFHYIRGNIAQQIMEDGHIPSWFCY